MHPLCTQMHKDQVMAKFGSSLESSINMIIYHTLIICYTECEGGYYGETCSNKCGKCRNDENCDKTNGTCTSCLAGYKPPMCQGNIHMSQSNQNHFWIFTEIPSEIGYIMLSFSNEFCKTNERSYTIRTN